MRLKTELYEKEQNDLSNKIIDILELDDENKERPSYLCRNISGVLHDTSKPKFTRLETVKPC